MTVGRKPIQETVSGEDRAKLLRAVRAGASNTTCAELVGISRSGYSTLLDTDDELRISLGKARAESIVEILEKLRKGQKHSIGWLTRVVRDPDYVHIDKRVLPDSTGASETLLAVIDTVTKSDAFVYQQSPPPRNKRRETTNP